MDNEQVISMDSFILLSIINMKLRDYYKNLDSLCEDFDVDSNLLINKLNSINYYYDKTKNQFLAK